MASFLIRYGVGGGYNDITEEVIEAVSQDAAERDAFEAAIQIFEYYGIYENNLEEDEEWNDEAYREELERWIEYSAELVS